LKALKRVGIDEPRSLQFFLWAVRVAVAYTESKYKIPKLALRARLRNLNLRSHSPLIVSEISAFICTILDAKVGEANLFLDQLIGIDGNNTFLIFLLAARGR